MHRPWRPLCCPGRMARLRGLRRCLAERGSPAGGIDAAYEALLHTSTVAAAIAILDGRSASALARPLRAGPERTPSQQEGSPGPKDGNALARETPWGEC